MADLLKAILDGLSATQHDFTFFCDPRAAKSIGLDLDARRVSLVTIESPSWLQRQILGLKYLSPLFRRIWSWPGPLEVAARNSGVELLWFIGVGVYESTVIPYVATVWDLQHRLQPFFPEVNADGQWDAREQRYSQFLRRATYCVTGTDVGKGQIVKFYQLDDARVRVLPLPTPRFALESGAKSATVEPRVSQYGEYVFYPAQFWSHKNHINLFLAIKWLHDIHGLRINVVLTGSNQGNLRYVKRMADELGISELVQFLGFVSKSELVELYQGALALTFTTYFGPDNIPPLEAFALGCPVIASNVNGAEEQLGDAAILVDPSNPEHIGRAILALRADDTLREQLCRRGYARATLWTSANYVNGVFKLFDEFSAVRRNWGG